MSADRDRRLDELLSKQEIHDRLCDYMRGQDRLDPVLHRSVFWDDATTDYGICKGDADGFVAFAQNALGPHKSNQHLIGQVRIDLEGDVGFGEVYFIAFHRIEQDGADRDLFIPAAMSIVMNAGEAYGKSPFARSWSTGRAMIPPRTRS